MNSNLKTNIQWSLTLAASLCLLELPAHSQIVDAVDVNAGVASEAVIVEKGPDHRVFQYVVELPGPRKAVKQVHRYTELASGLHYLDGAGQWQESQEQIEIVNGFGVATQGQIQVIFSPNLNTSGAIDVVTPDGRFQSTVLGLAFTDISGKSVLIAEVTNSTGQLVADNEVIYPAALVGDGVTADARYTYRRGSFEQEILIRSQMPPPSEYGLDDSTTRLEVWTEFFEAPSPQVVTRLLAPDAGAPVAGAVDQYFSDDTLDFGTMRIGPGTSFSLSDVPTDPFEEPPVAVGKTWTGINDRQFLIEKVPLSNIASQLAKLPKTAGLNEPNSGKGAAQTAQLAGAAEARKQVSRPPLRPRKELLLSLSESRARSPAFRRSKDRASIKNEAGASAQSLLASRGTSTIKNAPGVSIDYTLMVSQTNWTFRGDSTYLINGAVNLAGTTVLEGGACLKFTNGTTTRITLQGPLDCRTSPYRPAIFTGKNDDSVGETISGSSGNPATNWFGKYIDLAGNTNAIDLHDVRICHAYYAINLDASTALTLRHAQLTTNYTCLVLNGSSSAWLRNVLLYDGTYAMGNTSSKLAGEHVTFHKFSFLRSSSYTNLLLTNSLVLGVANNVLYSGVNVISNLDDTGIFQTVGAGSHYLSQTSPYRDYGTTNIDPTLAADLKARTTWPPIVLSNNISLSTVLSPSAQRDTDIPDAGYEYDPIDYLMPGITLTSNAVLLVTNGTVIAFDVSSAGYGLKIDDGAKLISEGIPNRLNRFCRIACVQEASTSAGAAHASNFTYTYPSTSGSTARFRFSDLPMLAGGYYHFYSDHSRWCFKDFYLQDSQIRGGMLDMSQNDHLQTITWLNNLFEEVNVNFYSYATVTNLFRNNLFEQGYLTVGSTPPGSVWTFYFNMFDKTTNSVSGTVNSDANGFVTNYTQLPAGDWGNVILTNSPAFQVGPLGRYYLPSGSRLIDGGFETSAMYQYTTTTNQARDTGYIDIGLHYIITDAFGNPLDSDGDGSFDYMEDRNFDGIYQPLLGETDWQTYDSKNKLTGTPGLQVYTPLK